MRARVPQPPTPRGNVEYEALCARADAEGAEVHLVAAGMRVTELVVVAVAAKRSERAKVADVADLDGPAVAVAERLGWTR